MTHDFPQNAWNVDVFSQKMWKPWVFPLETCFKRPNTPRISFFTLSERLQDVFSTFWPILDFTWPLSAIAHGCRYAQNRSAKCRYFSGKLDTWFQPKIFCSVFRMLIFLKYSAFFLGFSWFCEGIGENQWNFGKVCVKKHKTYQGSVCTQRKNYS